MPSDRTSAQVNPQTVGRLRWAICALLFVATMLNYIDRQAIGILKPDLTDRLGWSQIDYSNIVLAFQIAYAIGYAGAGRLIDRVGVRIGYAVVVLVWTLAAMAHALNGAIPPGARLGAWVEWAGRVGLGAVPMTVVGFCAARFALGLAEGGNFPAAIRTVSEWFPKKERALATGLFNSGCNVGAIVAPAVVPLVALRWNWPVAFLITAPVAAVWLVAWWLGYHNPDRHPRLSALELAYIRSDPPDPVVKVPWLALLRYRQTWAFVVGMFLSGPIWWFYLYWIPGFLYERHGLDLLHLGPPLITIYMMTNVGSVGGGWLSSSLILRGWSVNAARKTALLVCALCVVPVFAASSVSNLWVATVLIGLAASAHQGFSANLYTLVSDTAPRHMVSSIVGIGGMAAAIGGMFIAKLAGYVLEWTGSYRPLFVIASCSYLVNVTIIHALNPRLEPMRFAASQIQKD